jgi:hypothetical protein
MVAIYENSAGVKRKKRTLFRLRREADFFQATH